MVRKGSAKVTLSDVASRAGVSVTTASFVLSGRRDMRISEATQERVHQSARELSYVPRNPAGSSRSGCNASSPAPGPVDIPMATARLSVTAGLGATSSSIA